MCWLTVCFSARQHLKTPPQSVVLVGHSMGGVVARALYTLPRFNPSLVSLIITHASPHLAPVLVLDPHLLGKDSHAGLGQNIWKQWILIFTPPPPSLLGVDFYSSVQQRWVNQANKLRNVTVLSVGGGYRDYQVRSGLISLPCPPGDPNKLSLVVRNPLTFLLAVNFMSRLLTYLNRTLNIVSVCKRTTDIEHKLIYKISSNISVYLRLLWRPGCGCSGLVLLFTLCLNVPNQGNCSSQDVGVHGPSVHRLVKIVFGSTWHVFRTIFRYHAG